MSVKCKSENEYYHDEFCRIFNDIRIKRFEHINLYEVASVIFYSGIHEDKVSWIILLKIFILEIFYLGYDITRKGNESIMVLFSNSYSSRKDYREDIEKVVSCMNDYIFIKGRRKLNINTIRLKNLRFVFSWIKNLRRAGLRIKTSLFCCLNFFEAICTFDELKRININHKSIRLFLSYCDFHVSDYYMENYYRKNSIATATLQHGNYSRLYPYPFQISKSNYWLAINNYTVDEARASGYDVKKMRIVGAMRDIGLPVKVTSSITMNGIIGITLTAEDEDIALLNFSELIIKNFPYKIIIRLHPGSVAIRHNVWNYESCEMDDANAQPIYEFYKKCDFVITGNSSVFGDLIGKGYPVYRMTAKRDMYSFVKTFQFSNWVELKKIIEVFYNKSEESHTINELRKYQKYFSPYENVEMQYRLFISDYSGKNL